MPLVKSASKKAFGKNIGAEMKAGRPQKQSIAIAFAVKKKAGGIDNFAKAKSARLDAQQDAQARPASSKKKKLTAFA